jgi:hypothetical protein
VFVIRGQIPAQYQLLMMILLFVYVVVHHSRLVEITSRLDFLWKKQAERELTDMKEVRTYNSQLLKNILPDHVATHFLVAEERRLDVSQSRRKNKLLRDSDVHHHSKTIFRIKIVSYFILRRALLSEQPAEVIQCLRSVVFLNSAL